MNERELFHRVMRFECPGRTLATLSGVWPSTFERWHREGMPAHLQTVPDLWEHFGLDRHLWGQFPGNNWVYPPYEKKILEETEETVTYVHERGFVCQELKTDAYKSMPHFIKFPVETREDWAAFRERLCWTPE